MEDIQPLPAGTHIGSVHLKVSNLENSRAFYVGVLGFREVGKEASREGDNSESTGLFSADGNPPVLIQLSEEPGAIPKPRNSTGLYHVAIRVPDQAALGTEMERVRQNGWRFQGAADHLVSEALYLADSDGNGLEIYADRDRESWPRSDDQIVMASDPLDMYALRRAASLNPATYEGIHPDTVIGHVHLHVADLSRAEDFYQGLLGFDVTQRSYPGALFLSAGGYHHHLGLNIWAGKGAPPPPPNAVGLASFTVMIPDGDAWWAVIERLREAGMGVEIQDSDAGFVKAFIEDPSQNGVKLEVEKALLSQDVRKKINIKDFL